MRYGREVTGALSGGAEILNGIREQEPKSVWDVWKTSENSQMTSPKAMKNGVDQPEPWRSNLISGRCKGVGPDAKNACLGYCSSVPDVWSRGSSVGVGCWWKRLCRRPRGCCRVRRERRRWRASVGALRKGLKGWT